MRGRFGIGPLGQQLGVVIPRLHDGHPQAGGVEIQRIGGIAQVHHEVPGLLGMLGRVEDDAGGGGGLKAVLTAHVRQAGYVVVDVDGGKVQVGPGSVADDGHLLGLQRSGDAHVAGRGGQRIGSDMIDVDQVAELLDGVHRFGIGHVVGAAVLGEDAAAILIDEGTPGHVVLGEVKAIGDDLVGIEILAERVVAIGVHGEAAEHIHKLVPRQRLIGIGGQGIDSQLVKQVHIVVELNQLVCNTAAPGHAIGGFKKAVGNEIVHGITVVIFQHLIEVDKPSLLGPADEVAGKEVGDVGLVARGDHGRHLCGVVGIGNVDAFDVDVGIFRLVFGRDTLHGFVFIGGTPVGVAQGDLLLLRHSRSKAGKKTEHQQERKHPGKLHVESTSFSFAAAFSCAAVLIPFKHDSRGMHTEKTPESMDDFWLSPLRPQGWEGKRGEFSHKGVLFFELAPAATEIRYAWRIDLLTKLPS